MRFAFSLIALAIASSAYAGETNPCSDYLTSHYGDEKALQVCMGWMGSIRPGHIAVGPSGEVAATFLRKVELGGQAMSRTEIFAVVDPDGIDPLGFPDPDGNPNPFCPPLAPAGMGCI